MKNFIEVSKTEEEQVEQIKKWVKENGIQIIVGIIFGLGGIWGFNAYKTYQYSQAIEARTAYLHLVSNPQNSNYEALQNAHADSGYAQQSALIMAKNAVKNKAYQTALNHLIPLANTNNGMISGVARMRAARVYLQMGNFEQALTILNGATTNTFDNLYNHLRGDIHLADGKIDTAKKHYQLALNQTIQDSELYALIQIKLNDLN